MMEALGTWGVAIALFTAAREAWKWLNKKGKRPDNVLIWIAVWFAMMCWEAYDLHPDHALFYSVLLLGGAYLEIHRWSVPWFTLKRTTG